MIKNLFLGLLSAAVLSSSALAANFRDRLPEDEVIYFLLPDRFENGDIKNDKGGLKGDYLKTGFDPSRKGFYHGGDLKGLINRLDYIQGLGITAIWLAPVFKNKAVQGNPGNETAGYHGYWVTDFTQVDPHFGTNADFKTLVDAAHARGMKVYMDIITNHTADVISYKECPQGCSYRSRADYPYSRRGSDGAPINPGFLGESVQTPENFAKLTDPNFAYTPFIPKGEEKIKKPEWLNDITLYHNRGNSTFSGENSTQGDFVGLDDPMTENPRVVQGFIDIYKQWIDQFGIDGYRVDTAKHVNTEFWTVFTPAIIAHAKARGIPNFHIFGEVHSESGDVAMLARFTHVAKMQSVLDFGFRRAAIDTAAGKTGTDMFAKLFEGDALYDGGVAAAHKLPTFLGNHDAGRFAREMRLANPNASDDEILKRTLLGHALLLTLRGVPTIYSGDEQGFVGDGGDQDAREDMFASRTAVYNDNKLLGTAATTAQSNFNAGHPLYKFITELATLRKNNAALRRGTQIIRNHSEKPGLFAISRIDPDTQTDVLLVFNTSGAALQANVEIDPTLTNFDKLYGTCPAAITVPGSVAVALDPFDFMICRSSSKK